MKYKLTKLEKLYAESYNKGIFITHNKLPENMRGFYYEDNSTEPVITISPKVKTYKEEACVLAEELGHYYTSNGDILVNPYINPLVKRKQEEIAKRWAIKKLITFNDLIKAYEYGVRNLAEMAEYLDVTEKFLKMTFDVYYKKYGKYKIIDEQYTIFFDPPGILKKNI